MDIMQVSAMVLFCQWVDIGYEMPANLYLQCRHADYEIIEYFEFDYDKFLEYIFENENSIDFIIQELMLEYGYQLTPRKKL